MRKLLVAVPFALMLVASAAVRLYAQAPVWDVPTFFSPRPGEDIGIYTFKPDLSGYGFEGIWRQEGNLNLGVRAGVTGAGDLSGKRSFMVGSEFYKYLGLNNSQLLVSYMLGAGATFGDKVTQLRIPFGVSIGTRLGAATGIDILPYVHPRVAFDLASVDLGNGNEDTTNKFNFDVDVGADIGLGSQFTGRFGATLTNEKSIGFGIAYRMSRKLVVK